MQLFLASLPAQTNQSITANITDDPNPSQNLSRQAAAAAALAKATGMTNTGPDDLLDSRFLSSAMFAGGGAGGEDMSLAGEVGAVLQAAAAAVKATTDLSRINSVDCSNPNPSNLTGPNSRQHHSHSAAHAGGNSNAYNVQYDSLMSNR